MTLTSKIIVGVESSNGSNCQASGVQGEKLPLGIIVKQHTCRGQMCSSGSEPLRVLTGKQVSRASETKFLHNLGKEAELEGHVVNI
jgi:hypothetical protein